MSTTQAHDTDALGSNVLSVALIGPQEQWRREISLALSDSQATVTREWTAYPELDAVARLTTANYDVIVIELDSDPEYALDLLETICCTSASTVMVSSAHTDSELLVRCMRAGAREFLNHPIAPAALAEALVRASVRRPGLRIGNGSPAKKKATGELLVFLSAKGGAGVTTIAANFAIALAQESTGSVLLIDLDLPLGNAALDLGISTQFSTANALQNADRLDANYLAKLLIKHSSGLSVLAAPDKHSDIVSTDEAIAMLFAVSRQEFDYVVVDAGSKLGFRHHKLLGSATTLYLTTQVGISELRNANRLITELLKFGRDKLQVVLNRFTANTLAIDENSIERALTMKAEWIIPSDFAAVRRAQNTATPLALADSPITRIIRKMAKAAGGVTDTGTKKRRFSLFGS